MVLLPGLESGSKKLLLLVVAATLSLKHSAAAYWNSSSTLGCQYRCGDTDIPYPFGIGPGCSLDGGFLVACDEEEQVAYLGGNKTLKVLEISVPNGEVRVQNRISSTCHNYTDNPNTELYQPLFRIYNPYFVVSNTKNRITAIGCATTAIFFGRNGNHLSGCASFCDEHGIDNSTQCTNMGCCQASIPSNLNYLDTLFAAVNHINYSHVWEYSPCSYAFVAEQNWFNFSASDAQSTNFRDLYGDTGVPLVLDWAIDTETCDEVTKNMSKSYRYACISMNSECIDTPNGLGYRCICSQGYQGNPYIVDGCIDINECTDPDLCHGRCRNTMGSYDCSCRPGTQSIDPKSTPCTPIPGSNQQIEVKFVIGTFICAIFAIVCIFILIMKEFQKRKLVKEKERLFKENGGPINLDKATNNFDRSRELGTGGHGTVYKGCLSDGKVVAVKRSKITNMDQAKEFIQEIIILSQINHRNVVRLLGCCLEVEVPILVYEFIPNGTLFDLIHSGNRPYVPLEVRLRIAQESAEALAYLHLSTLHTIIHGDVKSLNILLDENYKAKVSDFGASRILPNDSAQCVTMLEGTMGYMDPEYMKNGKLTEKSDVYSFGVVLLELITGKMAIYSEGHEQGERISLASSFMLAMKENRVGDILDTSIMCVGTEELFQEVAQLGIWCLSDRWEDRPSMVQVANKLKAIRSGWRELLLVLKNNETELVIQRPAVASTDPLHRMYRTASMCPPTCRPAAVPAARCPANTPLGPCFACCIAAGTPSRPNLLSPPAAGNNAEVEGSSPRCLALLAKPATAGQHGDGSRPLGLPAALSPNRQPSLAVAEMTPIWDCDCLVLGDLSSLKPHLISMAGGAAAAWRQSDDRALTLRQSDGEAQAIGEATTWTTLSPDRCRPSPGQPLLLDAGRSGWRVTSGSTRHGRRPSRRRQQPPLPPSSRLAAARADRRKPARMRGWRRRGHGRGTLLLPPLLALNAAAGHGGNGALGARSAAGMCRSSGLEARSGHPSAHGRGVERSGGGASSAAATPCVRGRAAGVSARFCCGPRQRGRSREVVSRRGGRAPAAPAGGGHRASSSTSGGGSVVARSGSSGS
ncbi:hypothetical protein U9M48_029894 [Paspalum notatum var. saurae]|uniref:Protein kinase domain-containing protein n=1 Tax=Paspalum notatum var. saurae TaxID=547442 RepID=A0AAQ3TZC6_PASNO